MLGNENIVQPSGTIQEACDTIKYNVVRYKPAAVTRLQVPKHRFIIFLVTATDSWRNQKWPNR